MRRESTELGCEAGARYVVCPTPGGTVTTAEVLEAVLAAAASAGATRVYLAHAGQGAPDVAGGLVKFADGRGVKRALAAAVRGGEPLDPPDSTARAVGLESWVNDFRDAAPGPERLQQRIDSWGTEFEAETARNEAAGKANASDDGWTVVEAKRGRRKTNDGDGTTVGGIRAATADRRRTDGPKIQENFYRHQQREARRNELFELKQAFAVDKDRVAKLKATRKFRPV